jgi:acyl dehydratase
MSDMRAAAVTAGILLFERRSAGNAPKGPSLAAGGAQPAPGHRDHERAKRELYGTMCLPRFCVLSSVIGIGGILPLKVDFAHIPMCRFHLRFVKPVLFG